jgi:hypothetical protein
MTARSKLVLFTVLTALLILFAMMQQEKEKTRVVRENVDTLKPFQPLAETTNLTAKRKELSP